MKQGLFKTVDAKPELPAESVMEGASGPDYENLGFTRAANMRGSTRALTICLNRLYQEFHTEVNADETVRVNAEQDRASKLEALRGKQAKHKATVEKLRTEKVAGLKDRLESLRDEARRIREDPTSVRNDTSSKASFWIGIVILVCLSIYLIVFYSSASYSAFFRNFSSGDIAVANAIFDAKAFSQALGHGVAEVVLITMMPFVFLGLGFLIHKFQQQQSAGKFVKVGALIAVTFVFDAILGYEITHKISDLQAQMAFQTPEPYTLGDAFVNVQFWLIIFAGFVVYLIWGFVFDFTMDENEKLDAVRFALRGKRDQIQQIESQVLQNEQRADILELAVANLNTEMNTLESSPLTLTFNPKDFKDRIGQFMEGWVHWLKANKHHDDAVEDVTGRCDEFLASLFDPKGGLGDGAFNISPALDLSANV